LFKAYKVEGISMQPLLQDGERIFVNKYVYDTDPLPIVKWRLPWTREPQHGDVVVFWYPLEPEKSYIKRVIGVPQDLVELRNGVFYVNNRQVNGEFVPLAFQSYQTKKPIVVPKGYYYCVGDHRNKSSDSRSWGTVPRKYIIGHAIFRYWPITEMGLIRYKNQPAFYVDETPS